MTINRKTIEGYILEWVNQKISNECEKGILVKIKRGLYTDDLSLR